MKYYFLMPDRDLINGLLFLHDDVSCMSMSDHTTNGGVADIFVEYNGEQDEVEQESGSDFEDEIEEYMDSGSEEDMPGIMTAQEEFLEQVFVPNDNGVITTVISSPLKRRSSEILNLSQISQVCNPSQPSTMPADAVSDRKKARVEGAETPPGADIAATPPGADIAATSQGSEQAKEESDSDDSEDLEYIPHTDDSGEESEK
ncbi:hypothetical protein D1007_47227 [Hordeum vulgare]|nr:hypothetical protein D1007_47227 [Hordeum vulgare]